MLKKRYRLTKNREFKEVYEKKNSVAASTVVLYIMSVEPNATPKVGFSVSNKVGNAVTRNRCKRMLREAIRLHIDNLMPGKRYVFIARRTIKLAGFQQIEKEVRKLLERKNCLITSVGAPNSGKNNSGIVQ